MATEDQIRYLAYDIWEQEGRPEGRDQEYYFRARQMLEKRDAALSPAEEPVPPVSDPEPPSAPKPIERHTGKRRSKKT